MQNTIKINTPYWFDAVISKYADYDYNGNFYNGIWYDGDWYSKRWFVTIYDNDTSELKESHWLNGSWRNGRISWESVKSTIGTKFDVKVSPKCFNRPKNTLSLNYAKYK